MKQEIVKTVTVTGADDSIRPQELIPIAEDFPFVEFGILLSKRRTGSTRFPSEDWLRELYLVWYERKSQGKAFRLSGHLCGSWVRKLCQGESDFFDEFGYTWAMFDRFQLNFHREPHRIDEKKFSSILRQHLPDKQIIFQMDGNSNNEAIFYEMESRSGFTALPLFDASGGAGVLPKRWPEYIGYAGYAGGLSPDNVGEELEKISKVARGHIWIDTETRVRSNHDATFDLQKVSQFLEVSRPWVITL
ncbi:MAG: hypothetical protein Q7S84_00790 [bacterium]|nr:hypothetical protein [bacterium]